MNKDLNFTHVHYTYKHETTFTTEISNTLVTML